MTRNKELRESNYIYRAFRNEDSSGIFPGGAMVRQFTINHTISHGDFCFFLSGRDRLFDIFLSSDLPGFSTYSSLIQYFLTWCTESSFILRPHQISVLGLFSTYFSITSLLRNPRFIGSLQKLASGYNNFTQTMYGIRENIW